MIQPFDRGRFDKRFDDVFAPAIKDAGLEPYRVDRDPSVTIPIEEIGNQISSSAACLCDITIDNPNVWFELGYAIASGREVVMVCADERTATHFPFDVQHRSIIRYSTESPSDFQRLREQIRDRLIAQLEKRSAMGAVSTMAPVSNLEGLDQFEVATLVSVAQQIGDHDDAVSSHMIRQDMENAGFTRLATTLGLHSLMSKNFLVTQTVSDYDGSSFTGYAPSEAGLNWLFLNKDNLVLRARRGGTPATPARPEPLDDSDIPF